MELQEVLADLLIGKRIAMSGQQYDSLIDQFSGRDCILEIASCLNRNRVGILDQYVVWIGKENQPTDLEYNYSYTIGSV